MEAIKLTAKAAEILSYVYKAQLPRHPDNQLQSHTPSQAELVEVVFAGDYYDRRLDVALEELSSLGLVNVRFNTVSLNDAGRAYYQSAVAHA